MTTDWYKETNKLVRNFNFKSFSKAIEFINKVSDVAEKQEHHPEILISGSKVTLRLWTHSENHLTEKDFKLAAAIDLVI
jgi:4a-hydroxytetrahydrobiopterin dehydratase